MKTVLLSLLILTVIVSLVGSGLFAHFSDVEESTGNQFQSGTLNLKIDDTEELPVQHVNNMKPCVWHKWDEHDIANVGTIGGPLSLKLDLNSTGVTAGSPGAAAAQLQNYLDMVIIWSEKGNMLECLMDDTGDMLPVPINWQKAVEKLIAAPPPGPDGITNSGDAGCGLGAEKIKYSATLSSLLYNELVITSLLKGGTAGKIQVLVHVRQGLGDPVPTPTIPDIDPNLLQGDWVKVDKTYSLTQGSCDQEGGGGKILYLPPCDCGMMMRIYTYSPGDPANRSYVKIMFKDIPDPPAGDPPYAVQNGVYYRGWCVDLQRTIYYNIWYPICLMSSLDPAIYGHHPDWHPESHDFNYVNYLINHFDQANGGEGSLQRAIWYFINGGISPSDTIAQAMIQEAQDYGFNYVPDGSPGNNWVMVVCFDGDHTQIMCVEVDPE